MLLYNNVTFFTAAFIFIINVLLFIHPVYAQNQQFPYIPEHTADEINPNDNFSRRAFVNPDTFLLDTHPYEHRGLAGITRDDDRMEIRNRDLPADMLPDPRVLKRPKDSPIPLSGVPIAPWPGVDIASMPMLNVYQTKKGHKHRGHIQNLDALFGGETFSSFLDEKTDALRFGDLGDPYYVPTSGWGHVLPQLMPFRRKLQKKGITFSLVWKSEAMDVFHGGERRGMDYAQDLEYSFSFDLGRLFGFRNWTPHLIMMHRDGREMSHDRLGEYLMSLQEIYGLTDLKAFRLSNLYAQKIMLHNKLDIAFGKMTVTNLFATSPLLATYMSICPDPDALKLDPGMSVYPKDSWGGRLIFRPTRDSRVVMGAFQVYPMLEDQSGWAWESEHTTGLSLPIEFTWRPFLTHNRLYGEYRIGFMHDTSNYEDIFGHDRTVLDRAYRTLHHSGHARFFDHPGGREPMNAFWFEMEQMFYRLGGRNEEAGGYFLAGAVHNTPHVATFDNEFYVGFSLNGLFKNRLRDRFGVMYSWYHLSDRRRDGQRVLLRDAAANHLPASLVLADAYGTFGSLGPQVKAVQTGMSIFEAYYAIAAAPGILLQPTFLYQFKPGETHHIPDAAMIGIKAMANF